MTDPKKVIRDQLAEIAKQREAERAVEKALMEPYVAGEYELRQALDDPLAVAGWLDRLAHRLSRAIYYESVGPIGGDATGLRHDDYDLLHRLAKRMRRAEYLRLAESEAEDDGA